MRISRRIREIEKLIPTGSVIADIGCDHAYLDCLAVQNGRIPKAYACDVAIGPLENAKKTIREMHCEDRVFPILSDGLTDVPHDAQVCVISGMGFETMKMILEKEDLSRFKMLILQANCDLYALRKWIIAHGLCITKEKMVHEGHYYTILVVENGHDHYSEEDYIFGKYADDEVFYAYWRFRKERIEQILEQLHDAHQIKKFQQLIMMIQNKLNI